MHAIYTSLLAFAALTVAQDLSDTTEAIKLIPACALGCFTEGIANSTCGPTDAYCQCTAGATDIAKVVVPCLCQAMAAGECAAEELMKADEATMKICTAALKTKGETFKAPPPADPSMCSAYTGSSGGSASGNTTAGNSTGSENTTSTSTSTSSGASSSGTSPSSSTSGAPTVGAIESFKFMITCGMLGLAGVALMVL